jgi:hypothetical protein
MEKRESVQITDPHPGVKRFPILNSPEQQSFAFIPGKACSVEL